MRLPQCIGLVVLGGSIMTFALASRGTPYRVARADDPAVASATYVGVDACKKCHFKQWKTWSETKMAHAFESLKPQQAVEAKKKYQLDPAKDYTKETCVRCHTTGYGEPNGGYPKVDQVAANEANTHLAAERQGVQCEDCHGAGSLYNAYMVAHEKDYDAAAGKKLGLVMPEAKNCLTCHHGGADGSPTLAEGVVFDAAAKMKEEGAIHAHVKK